LAVFDHEEGFTRSGLSVNLDWGLAQAGRRESSAVRETIRLRVSTRFAKQQSVLRSVVSSLQQFGISALRPALVKDKIR
jgi:hypothetical protein